jgi:hypothetical protein
MHRTTLLAAAAVAAAVAAALYGMNGPAGAAARDGLLQFAQAAAPLPIPQQNQPSGTETPTSPPAAPVPAPQPETSPAAPAKDQSQLPPAQPQNGNEHTPPASSEAAPGDQATPDDGESQVDELSLGEIPVIEVIELTPDIARRALDSYLAAKEKYADAGLDQFENLQDFVDQTEDGKKFEADVKAAGFANVDDWNLAITSLTVMYGSVLDGQDADLEQQVKEIEGDFELAQDMKDRMVKSIRAMIPSPNNRKVIEELMADPVYGERLKQLDIEEE